MFTDYQNTINHFSHPASFEILISKVQDFGNIELSPMELTRKQQLSMTRKYHNHIPGQLQRLARIVKFCL